MIPRVARVDGRAWLCAAQVARLLGVSLGQVRAHIPPVRIVAGRRWYASEGLETLRARLRMDGEKLSPEAYRRAVAYDQGVAVS